MSNQRFTPEFKDEAVRQVVERGYSVKEVAERVGVSARTRRHSHLGGVSPEAFERASPRGS
jgi:transposase